MESGCISNIGFLSFRVIFHFHDYGRKGKRDIFWGDQTSWISISENMFMNLPLIVDEVWVGSKNTTGILVLASGVAS